MNTGTIELFAGEDANGTSEVHDIAMGMWGIVVGGTLDGSISLEVSDDNGTTWVPVSTITVTGYTSKFLPAGKVRATLSGVTTTDVNVRLKPVQL